MVQWSSHPYSHQEYMGSNPACRIYFSFFPSYVFMKLFFFFLPVICLSNRSVVKYLEIIYSFLCLDIISVNCFIPQPSEPSWNLIITKLAHQYIQPGVIENFHARKADLSIFCFLLKLFFLKLQTKEAIELFMS